MPWMTMLPWTKMMTSYSTWTKSTVLLWNSLSPFSLSVVTRQQDVVTQQGDLDLEKQNEKHKGKEANQKH